MLVISCLLLKSYHSSSKIEGIYLDTIKKKLSIINEYWNKYYFSKQFFQKKINFTKDVQTNYYGDLNNYFGDTLNLVKEFEPIKNIDDYISKAIVLLQTIYVHQDLIDELLYIFKLESSKIQDKNPNREMRNELIGHPIRKKGKVLKSSILFALHKELSNDLNYTKYSANNGFHPEEKTYSVKGIIENHKFFLNLYLDKIIEKIKKEESSYNKKLTSIFQIPLGNQFDFIDHFDKNLLSEISTIFETDNLKYYYENQDKHERYKYAIKLYKEALKQAIDESQSIIKTYDFKSSMLEQYDIEQLYKKDKIFNIDFYIKKYNYNKKILEELLHMKKHIKSDVEYYASLEYIKSMQ